MKRRLTDKPGTDTPSQHETPECCICREPVDYTGYCRECRTWPINVTPRRACGCGRLTHPDGWCHNCNAYQATALEPIKGEWLDTGAKKQLLSKEENGRRLHVLMDIASGRITRGELVAWMRAHDGIEPGFGWDEAADVVERHVFGINRQYASRHLQAVGVVVGSTEQGDEILAYPTATRESIDEQKARILAMAEQQEDAVPF